MNNHLVTFLQQTDRPLSTMKILLHALVGYLAVTALPFHPFAFASESPLAIIDYDGYVNTTQKHSDSALMRRASDDIIEERQAAAYTIPGTLAVIALIGATYFALRWIHDDDPVRGNDVEFLAEHFDLKSSARNVRRSHKTLSPTLFHTIQHSTGLFATPPIPSILMELRARTGVTPTTN